MHQDLAAAEQDWRRFEQTADCTPFQTFDWLSAWQRHIGTLTGVTPAIVVGRRGDDILFVLPLAVRAAQARAPPDVPRAGSVRLQRAAARAGFLRASSDRTTSPRSGTTSVVLLQATPALRHDTIALAKMPETIGAQPNPMLCLDVQLNPSGAYETVLGTDWEQFYTSKRSSATRRRDRTKLKRLGELGEVKLRRSAGSAARSPRRSTC